MFMTRLKDIMKLKNFPRDEVIDFDEDEGRVTLMRDGVEIELDGPFCEMCGAHMGEEYCPTGPNGGWSNPHNYSDYDDNKCHACGQEYVYHEGDVMNLTEEDLAILRKAKGLAK